MKVLHITKTPCAGAPGMLNQCLNDYSDIESKVFVECTKLTQGDFSMDYKDSVTREQLKETIEWADIIHLHNQDPEKYHVTHKPFVIQLHSEPAKKGGLVKKYPRQCITIAQKHATLYHGIPAVPNLIPLDDPSYTADCERGSSVVTIVYSPTDKRSRSSYKDTCRGKGYDETLKVLNAVKNVFKDKVKIHILTGQPKEVVLMHKRHSDIVIDECVTGGYHLSGLEGLATGNLVFGFLNQEVKELICKITGSPGGMELPWYSCKFDDDFMIVLHNMVECILDSRKVFNEAHGIKYGRQWMEEYWHPKKLIEKHYKPIYGEVYLSHTYPSMELTA